MSLMLPSYLSPEVRSSGEREVFELLATSPGTEDWVAFHSLNVPKHLARPHHEIDFVVMAPGQGIFCLEVKSGDIKRESGVWITVDRFGIAHENPISPLRQAEKEMHTLRQKVQEKFGPESRLSGLLYSYGVMFPHVIFESSDIEMERWRIYDMDTAQGQITDFIAQLSKNTRRQLLQYHWFNERDSIPDKADIQNLQNYLRPDFEFLISIPMRLGETEERISSFTEEQYSILDGVALNERVVFHGAAGTGKTVLAIESAKRSLCKPERTLVLCFNKLLASWINHCLDGFLYEEMGRADAICDFMESLIDEPEKLKNKARDMYKDEQADDRYLQAYYGSLLPQAALEKIRQGYVQKYDKIIIDEGQDIIREEYLDVIDALLEGTMACGKWEFYCDFEKQNIFLEDVGAGVCLKLLEKYCRGTPFQYRLTRNCRNTKLIAKEISDIFKTGSIQILDTNPEGIAVKYWQYEEAGSNGDDSLGSDGRDSGKAQCRALEEAILDLRRQGIAGGQITILSPYRMKNSCVSGLAGRENIIDFSDDHLLFLGRGAHDITFGTIYKFKGMENSCIIIADIAGCLDRSNFEDLLYVGMSRARFGLIVLVNGQTLARLEALKK